MTAGSTTGARGIILLMVGAILANSAAGLLYVWSLFILPIEGALALSRADLGMISSLALVSFTAGVSVLPLILARTGRTMLVILIFFLMAGGHLAFGIWPERRVLTLGYGLGFGAGSGLAYGLALSLAAALPDRIRAPGIGLALGAFALSGMILPLVLGNWIEQADPSAAFFRIGIAMLLVGACCAAVLAAQGAQSGAHAPEVSSKLPLDKPFFVLSFVFLLICIIGLAIMSQAAAIAADARISAAAFATTALTLGYLGGSLLGAPIAGALGERVVLFALCTLALIGALAIHSSSPVLLFSGAALVGASFGGCGSIMPVLLGLRYGAANISRAYGRMIIAYGLAGLVAPGAAGLLYDSAQSYAPTLILCAALSVLAMAALPLLNRASSSH